MPRVCLPIVAAVVALIFVVLISGASGQELLVNGGFETGDTQGWNSTGSLQISTVAHSGGFAGQLTSDGLQNITIFQSVLVQAARRYQFSGWVVLNDPAVDNVMLSITWFDASDNLLPITNSPRLTGDDPAYRPLTTGELSRPPGAVRARISVTASPASPGNGAFTVYLDDLSLTGTEPLPTDTPAVPTATPISDAGAQPQRFSRANGASVRLSDRDSRPHRITGSNGVAGSSASDACADAGRTTCLPGPGKHRLRGPAR